MTSEPTITSPILDVGTLDDADAPPLVSILIAVRNEEQNIAPLVAEIEAALAGVSREILFVDDGSTDGTSHALSVAGSSVPNLRVTRHRISCGKSAALVTGAQAARGFWIATMDGDCQDDPRDIKALLSCALNEEKRGAEPLLVAGHRINRRDTLIKRLSSRFANRLRARLLGDATPDTACGLKLYRRAAFLALPHFDNMHRFLPALFIRAGGRVISVPVTNRPRLHGVSNYGTFDRAWAGLFDLIGVAWLQRRGKRPEVIE